MFLIMQRFFIRQYTTANSELTNQRAAFCTTWYKWTNHRAGKKNWREIDEPNLKERPEQNNHTRKDSST